MSSSQRPARSRSNLAGEVSSFIREAILTGQLRPGERIDQDAIAEQLGLSRLPVREALIALDREGFVQTIPRRGSYVQRLTPQDIADHYEIFGHVAGLAASRAVAKLTDADLDRLEALHNQLQGSTDSTTQERLNFEFHQVINVAADSPRLANLIKLLSRSLPAHFFEFVPEWSSQACAHHQTILDALRARDPAAAQQAMQAHLSASAELAVKALQDRGFFDPR